MTTYLQSSPCKFGSFHSFPSQPWCLFLNEVLKRDQAFNMEMLAPMFSSPKTQQVGFWETWLKSWGKLEYHLWAHILFFAGFAVSFLPMYRNLFEGSRRYDKLQIMIYYPFSSILPYSCCACRHMYSGATIILLDFTVLGQHRNQVALRSCSGTWHQKPARPRRCWGFLSSVVWKWMRVAAPKFWTKMSPQKAPKGNLMRKIRLPTPMFGNYVI